MNFTYNDGERAAAGFRGRTNVTPKSPSDCQNIDRVVRYAERFFQRSGKTEFPTVRQVARALRLQQSEVERIVNDSDDLGMSYYNVDWTAPLGDHFVEVYADCRSMSWAQAEKGGAG